MQNLGCCTDLLPPQNKVSEKHMRNIYMQILHKQFHNLINSSTNNTRKTLYQTSDVGTDLKSKMVVNVY